MSEIKIEFGTSSSVSCDLTNHNLNVLFRLGYGMVIPFTTLECFQRSSCYEEGDILIVYPNNSHINWSSKSHKCDKHFTHLSSSQIRRK